MNAWTATPGTRLADVVDYEPRESSDEQDAQEIFARQLGNTIFEVEVIDAAANSFARRVLRCATIEQAQNEARAWLGEKPIF